MLTADQFFLLDRGIIRVEYGRPGSRPMVTIPGWSIQRRLFGSISRQADISFWVPIWRKIVFPVSLYPGVNPKSGWALDLQPV